MGKPSLKIVDSSSLTHKKSASLLKNSRLLSCACFDDTMRASWTVGLALASAGQYSRQQLGDIDFAAYKAQHLAKVALPLRITWIGDSTTFGQMEFLCDVVDRSRVRRNEVPSADCDQNGIRVVVGQNFGGETQPWNMSRGSAAYLPEPNASRYATDVVYFGSTLLHAMQLLPSRKYSGWKNLNVTEGLSKVAEEVRSRGLRPTAWNDRSYFFVQIAPGIHQKSILSFLVGARSSIR